MKYTNIDQDDINVLDALISKLDNIFTDNAKESHTYDNRPFVLSNIISGLRGAREELNFWFIKG